MNWEFVLNVILAFGLLFVIVLTIGFYISYKRDQRLRYRPHQQDPLEGRYFRRYLPDNVKETYDHRAEQAQAEKDELMAKQARLRFVYVVPVMIFVLVASAFIFRHYGRFAPATTLSEQEFKDLKLTDHQWKSVDLSNGLVDLVQQQLTTKTFVFVHSDKDNQWRLPDSGLDLGQNTLESWQTWLSKRNIESKLCTWKNLNSCSPKSQNLIYMILPGHWVTTKMDNLLAKGHSLLVLGPPAQLFEHNRKNWVWKKLSFKRQIEEAPESIILKGDSPLLIGDEAGRIIELPSLDKSFTVDSSHAVGFRHLAEANYQKTGAAAVVLHQSGPGRWAWINYLPPKGQHPESDKLTAGVFRYLIKAEASTIATWPHGKKYAAILAGDIEDHYDKTELALDLDIPITWFSVAQLAEKELSLTKKMAKLGPVNCQGDTHEPFAEQSLAEQTQRLALCQKILKKITHLAPQGLRPPEEKWDHNTLAAALNTGYRYLFVGFDQSLLPTLQQSQASGASMVVIPRNTSDDHHLYVTHSMAPSDRKRITNQQRQTVGNLGGIYVYDFHSQHLEADGHLELIKDLTRQLKSEDIYLTTLDQLADWWRLRSNYMLNVPVDSKEFEKFQPIRLSLDKDGKIIRKKVNTARNISSSH